LHDECDIRRSFNDTSVRAAHSRKKFHERGFACAVRAGQCGHSAPRDLNAHMLEHLVATEGVEQALCTDRRVQRGHSDSLRFDNDSY
jgi:ribosomal protein S26